MGGVDHDIDVKLLASVTDDWVEDGATVLHNGASPGSSWSVLDLSGTVGSKYSFVRIRVENTGGAADDINLAFAPNGMSVVAPASTNEACGAARVYLSGTCKYGTVEIPTDGDGKIKWYDSESTNSCKLTLIGYVEGPNAPTISGEAPTGASEAPNVNVSFDSADIDGDVSASGIDLELLDPDGVTTDVIIAGAWQAGYNGTISANGSGSYDIDVTTHPLFKVGVWQATATVTDDSGLSDSSTWSWTVDASGAIRIVREEPSGSTAGMPDRIYLEILDDWGVDISSIGFSAISVTGKTLTGIDGGAFQSGWSGQIIGLDDAGDGPKRVLVTITGWPDLSIGRRWTFAVEASDAVGVTL
jgi:hypothetical protein